MATNRPLLAIAAGVLALSSGMARAAAEDYDIDANHTFATFEISHLGVSTQRGRFGRASGKATLDADAGTGSVDIVLDARSLSTGSEAMEKLLRGKDLFNVDQFPEIRYRSARIAFADGRPQRIEGELTLLGVTRPVALTVERFGCTRKPFLLQIRCGMDATASFRRSDFGMESLIGFTSDEVKILIQAEAVQPPKPQPLD